ncbi:MAG TPA: site-specific DNA-methyltransferase [Abditibacteriaceae bacterium]
MSELPDASIDALITDPPYATTCLPWDKRIDWPAFWQQAHRVCKPTAVMAMFSAQPFTTELINSNRKYFRYEIIWAKTMATGWLNANRRPLSGHENILIFSRLPSGSTYNPQKSAGTPYKSRAHKTECALYTTGRMTDINNTTGERHPKTWMVFQHDSKRGLHPTQKPVPLMRHLVLSYTNPGDVVLDPFAGSGSTGVACLENQRRFIGIEKEPDYFERAKTRLEEIVKARRND